MYDATLYIGTGFNSINIPDSKSILDLATKITLPALDIYQARELSQFRVKITPGAYKTIQNADYLYLENRDDPTDFAFYSVQNITMTSQDVAVLDVTIDYILTVGGVAALDFLDGICERHHVATADDTFAKYTEEDPYLSPAEPLLIETEMPEFWANSSKEDITLIESTIDLHGLYDHVSQQIAGLGGGPMGIDYTSYDSNVVTVPSVEGAPRNTKVIMGLLGGGGGTTVLPNIAMYCSSTGSVFPPNTYNLLWVDDALAYARSLGVESAIISQYAIPFYMIEDTFNVYSLIDNYGEIQTLASSTKKVTSNLEFSHYYDGYNVLNKRALYGSNCKYHIVSIASGNSAEFLPEEIYDFATSPVSPTVEMRVDPRPNGAPYFRFDVYRNIVSDESNKELFFTNAVKGLQWQSVPLVYEGASGSLLNQYQFAATHAAGFENYAYSVERSEFALLGQSLNSMGKGLAGAIGFGVNAVTGNYVGAAAGLADMMSAGTDMYLNDFNYRIERNHQDRSWNIQKNAELQNLLIKNNVVAPSMNFPIAEGIRDFIGNSCLIYRTYYTDSDIRRIDKILSMYGYKHTTPIENSFLTNRTKFNYIQAKGVSIKNTNVPKWLRDGIAEQFSAGTRIWHQLPNATAYTDGSNT